MSVHGEVWTYRWLKNRQILFFYADADDVNMIDTKDDYDYINIEEVSQKKQRMNGFSPKYNNIVDYIVKITLQIWTHQNYFIMAYQRVGMELFPLVILCRDILGVKTVILTRTINCPFYYKAFEIYQESRSFERDK